jgi:hypothetical protein
MPKNPVCLSVGQSLRRAQGFNELQPAADRRAAGRAVMHHDLLPTADRRAGGRAATEYVLQASSDRRVEDGPARGDTHGTAATDCYEAGYGTAVNDIERAAALDVVAGSLRNVGGNDCRSAGDRDRRYDGVLVCLPWELAPVWPQQ